MINLMVSYAPAVTGYTKIILVFLGGAVNGMAVLHDVSALFYSILYSIAASVCIDICYTFGREKVDVVDEI